MSVLTTVGILLSSMLIMAFLQLKSGVFLLFLHYAFGKNARGKASDLGLFFIIGAETMVAVIMLIVYILLLAIADIVNVNFDIVYFIIAGILAAIGIMVPFCYYRKGKGTELFITRKFAQALKTKCANTKGRSNAFLMGFYAGVPELIFIIPLFLISILSIMQIGETVIVRAVLVILLVLASILPLIIIKMMFSSGGNLAGIERIRIKNKQFFRFFISLMYLITAVLIIIGVVG